MSIKQNFAQSITIAPILEKINEPIELFEDFLRNFEISDQDKLLWNLSLTEVLTNAIQHGSDYYRGDLINVHWKYAVNEIRVTIIDKGTGPYSEIIETPRLPEDLVAESGRGLYIVNSFVDIWLHERSINGYMQTLIKFMR